MGQSFSGRWFRCAIELSTGEGRAFNVNWGREDRAILNHDLQHLATRAAEPVLLGAALGAWAAGLSQQAIDRKEASVARVTERNSASGIQAIGNHQSLQDGCPAQKIRHRKKDWLLQSRRVLKNRL
jgi:hypothetical protein